MKYPLRLALLLSAAICLAPARAQEPGRERLLLDFGWRFHLGNEWGIGYGLAKAGTAIGPGNPSYSDASWRRVDLPHDWAIEMPFDKDADAAHGFRAVGQAFPRNSVGWYRRSFDIPASDRGRRLWLEFDGAYRDATVIVNGWFVGHHEGGYNSFRYDITDVADYGGRNVVAVRVDATQAEGWFYEGAGIYRHAWLVKTSPVSFAPDGIFVSSHFPGNTPSGPAEIRLKARVANTLSDAADASVGWVVLGPDGSEVARSSASVQLGGQSAHEAEGTASVAEPRLWSPETPALYTLVSTLSVGGKEVDREQTVFGIRTVAFDPDRGFLLNGKPYTLKGTSNHQDHAGVGSAVPDGVNAYRIARLKDMGCNAYRTAHNPPTPELLDACDRMGMIVMDENRQLGSDPRHMSFLDEQILRDRNHPSVCIWSLGNEEFDVQDTPQGANVVTTMQEAVRRLDPTRPITCNAAVGDDFLGLNSVIEVRGWSYHVGPDMDAYHRKHPAQPNVGSEQGSTVSTRGIYANDPVRGYVSSYDDNAPSWATTAEFWLSYFASRPWMSGGFVWTGFDYRGEPTPYAWPCINSHFGIMDTCGFAKDNFWYYKAWWTDAPVLHLLPHWNWPGREGQPIDVRAESNCDEVELFLNGTSLGRQAMRKDSELKWKVPYAAGTLLAVGYRGGAKVAEDRVETTGVPAAITLTPFQPDMKADGQSVGIFTVSVVDSMGRVVPTADEPVSFGISGPARILGVGNGDPSCHEPDTFIPRSPSRSVPVNGWRWKFVEDPYKDAIPEFGTALDDSHWEQADVQAGRLVPRERAVYRGHLKVDASELGSEAVELVFAKIAGGIAVYVNGTKVGTAEDSSSASVYDVKSLLHPGDNLVAVGVASYGPDATGLSGGVTLRLQSAPEPVHWSRSTFNGLAQVIILANKTPGTVTLTASSRGLRPASFALQSKPASPKPSVP